MEKKAAVHGGNIYKKARELHILQEDIMDFSANVSPLGIPEGVKKKMIEAVEGLINYPDPDCQQLCEAIGVSDGVSPDAVLCGNGGADLLFRMALGLKPKRVLLPVPAFVEYEEALRSVDAQIVYYKMDREFRITEELLSAMKEDQDLLVLCNPNNPTGLLIEKELLGRILQKAKELGIYVLLDECFLEIYKKESEYTMKGELDHFPNLMILKSFTKLYAIPGVRLGYLLSSNKELLLKMKCSGQAWSVSHFAQAAGLAALKETEYKEETIRTIEQENDFMKREISKLPVRLFDGAVNYLLFQTPGDRTLDQRMEKHGFLIRNCSNYVNLGDDYFRVAVKSHADNIKLLKALKEELEVQ
ncbi:MAG: pyridoxal phosphate-dependent class II aminotransferase [Lachnospiraceae bacterium]|nr:pyridoxal phosphate-dependent class II aminotransferase [Lachnospiraceae bacterium]